MSQIAVAAPKSRAKPVPLQAPGSAFLALMAGLWGAFVTLLAVSPSTLDDAYAWLREPSDRLGDPHVDPHAAVDGRVPRLRDLLGALAASRSSSR